MRKNKAFTIIELIVVVIIVGILATLGTVNYIVTKRRTEYQGAVAIVQSVAAAAKNRYLSLGSYVTTTSTVDSNNVYGTKVTDAKCPFHNYTTVSIAGPSFTVKVDYAPGDGSGAHTAQYTFDKNGVRTACAGADCLP